ncbi:cysteine desulfurase family protein [uncultured Selenomonas sp.]|uniref:cysteine desulfurase family protein n=1 Tax=uncultured Selenomonas sp. TaxID=159275 RepID=UPI0028D19B8D|nr:cysteine desulfurase family protein [uncultured Selenomonas sp.]
MMIYADHAATTALSKRALAAALPFLQGKYGNASSVYAFGKRARQAIERARRQVAEAVGAASSEILFTAGGSEGNNTVLRGVTERAWREGRRVHIVVSAIEHPSVLAPCRALERLGARIDYVPVSQEGRVAVESVATALSEETCLVSVMLANNEVGTVQDIAAIAELLKKRGVPLHADAVQTIGHIPVNVKALGVTYLTASGHKFGGMKGTGFLWQREGAELPPLISGGGQERGHRAGTENTAGVVALGEALTESVERMQEDAVRLRGLVAYTLQMIEREVPEVRVHGAEKEHLPGLLNIGIPGVRGESLVHLLDLKGICVSAASACSAGADVPSHVLCAMGYSEREAMEALRISYGRENTQEDAERIAEEIVRAVRKIRTLSGRETHAVI